MDRLFAAFSVYDFFSYVFSGGVVIAGTWWVIAGVPVEPGAVTVLGLIALAYITGHLVQAIGARWEKAYWALRELPSDARLDPEHRRHYDEELCAYIRAALEREHGPETKKFKTKDLFALARADLRARQAEGRAELMNTLYAFTRGLTTASASLIIIFIIALASGESWDPFGWALLVAAFSAVIFLIRFHEFGYRFADQVWKDFAALAGPQETS